MKDRIMAKSIAPRGCGSRQRFSCFGVEQRLAFVFVVAAVGLWATPLRQPEPNNHKFGDTLPSTRFDRATRKWRSCETKSIVPS
jgi:hypothetical protein